MKNIFYVFFFIGAILCSQEQEEANKLKNPGSKEEEIEYRTPRAGRQLDTTFLGIRIYIPARERDKTTAISAGTDMYLPKLGDDLFVPYAAFYYSDTWQEKKRRLRLVAAGVVNSIYFYDSAWNDLGIEFAGTWDNYTLPFHSELKIEDTSLEDSEIYWGYIRPGLGLGWRMPIPPHEIDSFFSIYLYYEPGFLYFAKTDNTGSNYILPPETYEDRIHLKIRLDAMERNIMELRHVGWASGVDFIRGHRYRWRDHDYSGSFKEKDTETYHLFTGYITWAGGPSWLSERHRFILSLYGGFAPRKELDRYSAPRIGGGPSGDEAEALAYSPIPGARFDEFIVSRYLLFSLEYRLELLFFVYLHFKGTVGSIRRMDIKKDGQGVALTKDETVGSLSVAITTGFLWDSQVQVQYAHDKGMIRGERNQNGHSLLVSWSKNF